MKKILIAFGLGLLTACGSNVSINDDVSSSSVAVSSVASSSSAKSLFRLPALRANTEKPNGLARINSEAAIMLEKSNYITKVDSVFDSTIGGYYQVVDISLGKDTAGLSIENYITNTSDTAVMVDSVVTDAGDYLTLNDLRGNWITKGQSITGGNILKLGLTRAIDTITTSDSVNLFAEVLYDQKFSVTVYASAGSYKTKLRINYSRVPDRSKSFGDVIVGDTAYSLGDAWVFKYSPRYVVNMVSSQFTFRESAVWKDQIDKLVLIKGDTTLLKVVGWYGDEYEYYDKMYADSLDALK